MNKSQLRELVKAHFNLVDHTPVVTEEKFGEIFDENKAFKIVFPGDTLKVGDEVRVVTTDGQESDAPDGFHKLIDGTVIKTEGSSVVEIESPEGKSEEEMNEMNGLGAVEDKANKAVEEAFAAKEDISQVEGTAPQNATTTTDVPVSELTGPVDTVADEEFKKMKEDMKKQYDEMKSMKDEMKAMKDKFEEFMMSPAKEKTMAAVGKVKMEAFSTATNDTALKVARELLKNKRK
jgi:hypothetical protein